jgi:general secretion pathway protein K
MQTPTELLAVKGMTPDLYGKLAANICALPLANGSATAINVNTATPALMQALTAKPGVELDRFISERTQNPAESVAELFNQRKALDAQAVPNSLLSVTSSYFELSAEIIVGSGRLALYSFYYRPGSGAPLVLGHSLFTE